MKNINELLSQVSQITASGLPMMEGKEKLEVSTVLNQVLTVDEYGYMEGDEGEYVVISLVEHPTHFIYGSSVVTQAFKKLDENFSIEDIDTILKSGLTFKLSEMTSKNKRKYTKIVFNPQS